MDNGFWELKWKQKQKQGIFRCWSILNDARENTDLPLAGDELTNHISRSVEGQGVDSGGRADIADVVPNITYLSTQVNR